LAVGLIKSIICCVVFADGFTESLAITVGFISVAISVELVYGVPSGLIGFPLASENPVGLLASTIAVPICPVSGNTFIGPIVTELSGCLINGVVGVTSLTTVPPLAVG